MLWFSRCLWTRHCSKPAWNSRVNSWINRTSTKPPEALHSPCSAANGLATGIQSCKVLSETEETSKSLKFCENRAGGCCRRCPNLRVILTNRPYQERRLWRSTAPKDPTTSAATCPTHGLCATVSLRSSSRQDHVSKGSSQVVHQEKDVEASRPRPPLNIKIATISKHKH